jgi:uncharacterized membrane protein
MSAATLGLATATFLASGVEFVEAFTIVLAMGLTRSWRAALTGTAVALLALTAVTAVAGVALVHWVSQALLQLVIGTLLLIFGLQWLRKAILRAGGLTALHDENAAFRVGREAARLAGHEVHLGLDWFAFVVSFKGVFLEGVEVVFIVITFGLPATRHDPHSLLVASVSAALAGLLVVIAGVIVRRPLAGIPENTMKYAVGLLLSSFGTFWAAEGLGYFASGESLTWPGGDWAILGILIIGFGLSRLVVVGLRSPRARRTQAMAARTPTASPAPQTPAPRITWLIMGFLGFWYDLIVGDAWEIATGTVVVVAIGAVLLRTDSIAGQAIPVLTAGGVAVVVAGSILTAGCTPRVRR